MSVSSSEVERDDLIETEDEDDVNQFCCYRYVHPSYLRELESNGRITYSTDPKFAFTMASAIGYGYESEDSVDSYYRSPSPPIKASELPTADPSQTLTPKPKEAVAQNALKESPKPGTSSGATRICVTNCRYDVVKHAARKYDMTEVEEGDNWNVFWTDNSVGISQTKCLHPFQIVNRFPGLNTICRKYYLAQNLNRMRKLFPKEFNIFPRTWVLPQDYTDLQIFMKKHPKDITYICKPEIGCQGRGIFLCRSVNSVMVDTYKRFICQLYIPRPFLLDDLKFDLRLYVLITSCEPLRVWVYNEGLARFATAKYEAPTTANLDNTFMHLTNYAVNKLNSAGYNDDKEKGTKRKLSSVFRTLSSMQFDVPKLVCSIDSVILKTVIAAHPVLSRSYKSCFGKQKVLSPSSCFALLGFDILLDVFMRPFVLEVNHSPSFHMDTKVDQDIKQGLIDDTMNMINLERLKRLQSEYNLNKMEEEANGEQKENGAGDKKRRKKSHSVTTEHDVPQEMTEIDEQFAYELKHCGGFRLIYPTENFKHYACFFDNMSSVHKHTVASMARAKFAHQQMELHNRRKQQEEARRVGQKRTESTPGPSNLRKPSIPGYAVTINYLQNQLPKLTYFPSDIPLQASASAPANTPFTAMPLRPNIFKRLYGIAKNSQKAERERLRRIQEKKDRARTALLFGKILLPRCAVTPTKSSLAKSILTPPPPQE